MGGSLFWVAECLVTFVLSIGCVLGLIVGWSITPESSERGITEAGRRLLRARLLFAIACGMIIACLVALIYLVVAPHDSEPFRWCDAHPFIVPILLFISFGISATSCYYAVDSRGKGRWRLVGSAVVISILSFLAAFYLLAGLSQ